MPEVDHSKEEERLKETYSHKGDNELLKLRLEYTDLTKPARDALRNELHRRNLWRDDPDLIAEEPLRPRRKQAAVLCLLRKIGFLLVNVAAALFGTAMIEAPFSQLYHPHSIRAVLLKGYLLSAALALALGFFVYRRWKPTAAKWVGVWGLGWFALGACLDIFRGSVWSRMSGTACGEGLRAADCMKWFIFSLPAVRALFYSLGAWLCCCIAAYGTSPIEDAVLGRFQSNNFPPKFD